MMKKTAIGHFMSHLRSFKPLEFKLSNRRALTATIKGFRVKTKNSLI